jgi:choline dehydrogenase-like flavoprotein
MTWDVIVIGSGFGGAMAAHALVHAGQRVLMLERGGWVARGPQNWDVHSVGLTTPYYTMESPYDVTADGRHYRSGSWHCVGGQSVFYGGASYRFRESDFEPHAEIVGDSCAAWPFRYRDIEPFYARAERLLGVAGETGTDLTEPPRSAPYPQRPAPLSRPAQAIVDAARRVGLTPSRIPLAISYEARGERRACVRCGSCDGYACAAEAKNDLATAIIPRLVREGMTLRPNTACVRLVREGRRIVGVDCIDRVTGARTRVTAHSVVLAAGALATPHLILASNLAAASPAGGATGRYLTRHCNAVVFGVFARQPNPDRTFDKQVAIMDFYDGDPDNERLHGRLGSIQQMTPPLGLVRAYVSRVVRAPATLLVSHSSGLLVIAEDQPQRENGVSVDWSVRDRLGMPRLLVRHAYTARDQAAALVLVRHARRVLRSAGALFTWVHSIETFSHALGTVRMGVDASTSPLDADGRFRGIDNLYVADGSALPRSAGVNPSLTIAANALRVGARLVNAAPPARGRVLPVLRPLPIEYNLSPQDAA